MLEKANILFRDSKITNHWPYVIASAKDFRKLLGTHLNTSNLVTLNSTY